MIVTKIRGGLGNQMFQYAMAKSLAIEKNKNLYLDLSAFGSTELRNFGLDHFNIDCNTYKKPNRYISKLRSYFKTRVNYRESDLGFHEDIFKLKEDDIYLKGYFQSEKYFIKYEKEIRHNFQITTPLKEITKQTIDRVKKVNSVALHIRRGDYLSTQLFMTDKDLYYKQAVELIENQIDNPVFFIFSDDMEWVKRNFMIKHETVYIDFNDDMTNFEDMKLMASCKHNVIANSSFSWWSAWLNNNLNKVVIAPKQWFNDDTIDTEDRIPENWIKL
jgi:hypothetical protein